MKAKILKRASFWTALIFSQAASSLTTAEPISIKGIDWNMSTNEQIEVFKSDGLTCLRRSTWGKLTPNSPVTNEPDIYFCINTTTPKKTTKILDDIFEIWSNECKLDRNFCYSGGASFREKLASLVRVELYAEDRVIFHCSYTNSCGISTNDILRELQKRVHTGPWERPTENSFLICTTGQINEALCLHFYSKAIWLLKQPITSQMDF